MAERNARKETPATAAEAGDPGAAARSNPVVVKKYANRRLYNTEASSYVTLDDLAGMVRLGRDFVVYDAKSGEDITRSVLTQIIVEEESKGRNLLPESFLRQIIGFYGDSLQSLVPRYLEVAMAGFSRQQEQMRRSMEQAMGGFMPFPTPFGGLEEMSKQNMAMMERAMSLFTPFRPGEPGGPGGGPGGVPGGTMGSGGAAPHVPREAQQVIEALRHEIEFLRRQVAEMERAGASKAEG
jgi:polyhydroxyalkanoate synthesis repressor PhaR